jgi:DNA-binding MarR family transcriptional regulator
MVDTEFSAMPGHLIRRAHQLAVAQFMEATRKHDVTPVQYALLAALAQSPHDVDQVTLAQRAVLDTSTAASTLDRMEAKGWIERRTDPEDRRRRVLHITRAGSGFFKRVSVDVAAAQERMLAPLSKSEQETLCGLLKKMSQDA